MIVPINHILLVGAALFFMGLSCTLLRRNLVMILIGVEIMLNAANLAFVAFAYRFAAVPGLAGAALSGQLFVFFVIGVAAAEAAVGLALFIALYRLKESIDVDRANILRW